MSGKRPAHPGKILRERFLEPLGLTPYRLAKGIGVHVRRVSELIKGRRGISTDTAVRLGLFFGVPPAWWLELQARHDTEGAPLVARLRRRVKRCPGLERVLVTPRGVRFLAGTGPEKPQAEFAEVPAAFLKRLRAQVALDPPRPPRRLRTDTYRNGAIALVGGGA